MNIEVIIANYNKPEFLALVLEGFLLQSDKQFTITIADDGSGPEIAAVVQRYAARGLTLRHLWHEDQGFRKNLILNKALRASCADYIIFIDNDCIPEPDFVADHRAVARPGCFVAGRRVNLGPAVTSQLIAGTRRISTLFQRANLLWLGLRGQVRYAELGLHLPWLLARLWSRKSRALLGANMAMWREDLYRINGFDAAATTYGLIEDTDVEWRLRAVGVQGLSLLGRGCVFHLDHPTRKHNDPTNQEYIRRKQEAAQVWAENGIYPPGEGPAETVSGSL
jgi:Predicted glycosyltransferases